MRTKSYLAAVDSRWLIALAIAAAGTPAAAEASSKLDNVKPLLAASTSCPVSFAPPVAARPGNLTQAILGGAPSALDRIRLSQQQGAASQAVEPAPAAAVSVPFGRDLVTAAAVLEPASRTSLSFGALPLPSVMGDCGAAALRKMPRDMGIAAPFGTLSSPDDELGTRAIPVKRTRFDDRWNRVRRAPSAALMQAQLGKAGAGHGVAEEELFARVNRWVNRQIEYRADDRNYRQRDYWATADQTLARLSGDCEDFAILKMHMLRAAGVAPSRMKLVLLRDLAANSDHAFLLVETDGGHVVLDNTTDRVYRGAEAVAVRPVLSFSENRRWVHAYRGTQPPFTVASVPAAEKSRTLAALDQRSVSAEPLTFKTGFSR
ncbi:MAG: transglutaminase-like cysteine peptidase [Sphingopyxis sp.]|uniref:transglutaminase-like cysteine peptidase n=1 Tax=Sphingopyxis sp. TaxID=1908224 RepID=UPI002AB9442B|nr:transglutaminase-like cysteine peptidase [Sphingopyxis sp.]MDZ3833289.1 transglutaminase-like cysteine peptidase [Sphingopyxis sp.]